ncbi:hypothetical protein Hanom_Chr05g00466001 [Helianthus anomalus]
MFVFQKLSCINLADVPVSNGERLKLYEKMSRDLDEHGALFLKHGETSQSLLLSDLFDMENGSVTPALKAAIPPVRANVLHLSTEYSLPISKAVRDVFSPTLSEGQGGSGCCKVVNQLCLVTILLDRVFFTSTGVLLGCWQCLTSGFSCSDL